MLLKDRRLESELTMEELAAGIGTRTNLVNVENGRQWASKATRKKIEALIGPVDWVSTRFQSFDGEHSDPIVFALAEYFFASHVVDPVDKLAYVRKVLDAFEKEMNQ